MFRDQEFTSDLRSRPVKRIADVKTLRARQFPEDQGPLAHPVRPSSYIEINNFYTPTVYEKGAEICRMMQTLIGETAFRKAMDLYFERHDGEAATVEDFVRCMADASGRDLAQFFRWYEQAGTPHGDGERHVMMRRRKSLHLTLAASHASRHRARQTNCRCTFPWPRPCWARRRGHAAASRRRRHAQHAAHRTRPTAEQTFRFTERRQAPGAVAQSRLFGTRHPQSRQRTERPPVPDGP